MTRIAKMQSIAYIAFSKKYSSSNTSFCCDTGGGGLLPQGGKAPHYDPGVHHQLQRTKNWSVKILQASANVPDQPLTVGNIWVGSVWYDWNHSKESIALAISLWMIVSAISVEWCWRYADWRNGRKLLLVDAVGGQYLDEIENKNHIRNGRKDLLWNVLINGFLIRGRTIASSERYERLPLRMTCSPCRWQ